MPTFLRTMRFPYVAANNLNYYVDSLLDRTEYTLTSWLIQFYVARGL